MGRRLYPYIYLLLMLGLLWAAFALLKLAHTAELSLPISFETPYEALRTVVALITFGFFLVLMARHVLLMLIAVADHADRYQQELHPERRAASPTSHRPQAMHPLRSGSSARSSSLTGTSRSAW